MHSLPLPRVNSSSSNYYLYERISSWDPDLFFHREMYSMYAQMANDRNLHIGLASSTTAAAATAAVTGGGVCGGGGGGGFGTCDMVEQVANSKIGVQETDEFRMYAFKIRRCSKTRNHDWTECPYAHRGEKARRRDPRKHRYLGVACAEFRHTGECSKGQQCEFAHGVFEFWLHPTRYRTRPCKAGVGCQRRVCFFAHTPEQLRVKERDPKWWNSSLWPRRRLHAREEDQEEEEEEDEVVVEEEEVEDVIRKMETLKLVVMDDGFDSNHALPDIDWICELIK